MGEARAGKVGAAVLTMIGALWLALSGACTLSFGKHSNPFGGLWLIGLWFMSIGVLPLVLGLRAFLPRRVLGGALAAAGAAWVAYGISLLIEPLTHATGSWGAGSSDVAPLVMILVFWTIFQAPGLAMLFAGLEMLRRQRGGASPGPPTPLG